MAAPRGKGNYIVVVMATGCGACEQFKKTWPQLKASLQNEFSGADIVEIVQPRVTTEYTSGPRNLNKWGVWFPTLMVVPRDQWDTGFIKSASVYNGTYNQTAGRVELTGNNPMTPVSVLMWARSCL